MARALDFNDDVVASYPSSRNDCDETDDEHYDEDTKRRMASSSKIAGRAIAPFLARHIPNAYAPTGSKPGVDSSKKDPSTKFCYRHRPDLKCRRTADEPSMDNLQRVSRRLSPRCHVVARREKWY